MSTFSIAGLQLALAAGDNVSALCHQVRAVKRRFSWIQMVLIGELAAFGPEVKRAQPLPGPTEDVFAALARETGLWLIPGTLYEQLDGAVFNTAPVIAPTGEVVARCRKLFPFLPYEKNVTPGETFTTFDIEGVGRFGVSICYDMWFPEITRSLVCQGAEIILHPSLTNTIDRDVELSIARANAAINQCYFFDINIASPMGLGRSIVAGPGGEVIHQAGHGHEVITVEADLAYVRRVRERGWNGLGQTLKSFRDTPLRFPAYGPDRTSSALSALGPLRPPPSGEGDA